MSALGIIPARMASTRFPGRPMQEIHGIPMPGHCPLGSRLSLILDSVWVATCDEEIRDVESVGGNAVMTFSRHERASDRAAEALGEVESASGLEFSFVRGGRDGAPPRRPGRRAPLHREPALCTSVNVQETARILDTSRPPGATRPPRRPISRGGLAAPPKSSSPRPAAARPAAWPGRFAATSPTLHARWEC